MKTRIVFVTGGTRSGKSGFAISLAEEAGGPLTYVATATPGDDEMKRRIEDHKEARGSHWQTVEEPLNVQAALAGIKPGGVVVLDCLTLWLTNLMMQDENIFEAKAARKSKALVDALRETGGTAIVVSNEVGMGIVPENASARLFRDVSGAANRTMAGAADEVYLVLSGIPLRIK